MKLKFTQDYIGRETAMRQYYKGDVDDISTAQALVLIGLEVAEEVSEQGKVPNRPKSNMTRSQKAGDK